jgi:hypothetical protein
MTGPQLAARLDKIEKANRRLRGIAIALAALVLGLVTFNGLVSPATASAQGGELRAQAFILVNANGDELAALELAADGQPMFFMREAAGAGITEPNSSRVMMSVIPTERGGGAFLAIGSENQGHITLRAYRDGRRPFAQIYLPGGNPVWTAP